MPTKITDTGIYVGHKISLPETGEVGEMFFNEADNKIYYWNGMEWIVVG